MNLSEGQPVVGVGVGGSGASTAALVWAAREARHRGARLLVIQAWQPHPLRALYAAAGYGRRPPPSTSAAAAQLDALVRSALGDTAGLDLVTEVVEGPAERVLADASGRLDLLVLGSGGQSPVSQVDPLVVDRPVGPVVRACLSHARCPVVIITPAMAPVLTGAWRAPRPVPARV
ncbi:MAG TPA: universal stress protein [Streptosporangiaceae bacterium]